jgi:hypothetical protein
LAEKGKKATIYKSRAESFVKTYATNASLEETDVDVRLYWFNEVIETTRKERVAVSDGVTILIPEAAVLLHEQLTELMDSWKAKGKTVAVSKERRRLLKALK